MPRVVRLFFVALAGVLAVAPAGWADVKLPAVFSDHMVLQRDAEAPVWGTATAGEAVSVAIAGQKLSATAGADGAWKVKLAPLKAGGPHEMTVTGKNSITLKNVLVGDVWIGSGQSNMAGGVNGYAMGDAVLAKLASGTYPQLRLCRGNNGRWQEATPETIKGFSALLFAFGQAVQKDIDVPVGLIVGAVGGTPSGRWLTAEMLAADAACQAQIAEFAASYDYPKAAAAYEKAFAKWQQDSTAAKAAGQPVPRAPAKPGKAGELRGGVIGDLYNANIAPVVPFAIRGVLWDQGESGTALEGVDQFNTMGALIKGWRKAWGQDFPFLYIQKPSGGGCAWDSGDPVTAKAEAFAPLPAQTPSAADGAYIDLHVRIMRHPGAMLVTARDLGSGVHPVNKSGYGHRAARVALGMVYGREVAICGPLYASHKTEGNALRIAFKHVGQGLAFKHGEKLQGFELAGEDGAYHWADARIDGETVVLTSTKVAKPMSARYAWSQRSPWANLFNKDGLPALTFKTQ